MPLQALHIENVRNLRHVDLELSPRVNLFFGANASGKTSLLEAIHILARAKSFLPVRTDRLVRHGADGLLVRGRVHTGDRDRVVVMLREHGCSRARLDGQDVAVLSDVTRLLPVQALTTESQRLLTDGPDQRRSFLNWGVFHVEHDYRESWRRYYRALRQRNAALRSGDARLVRSWETELVQFGQEVDAARQRYLDLLFPAVARRWARWLPEQPLHVTYRSGWPKGRAPAEALAGARERELDLGYTLYGPHRADLRVTADGGDAVGVLSRGQQKLAVIALRLAQAALVSEHGGRLPLLLIDDLAAELDRQRRAQVLEDLLHMPAQLFFTAIERDAVDVPPDLTRVFHVEQGGCREVI